MDSMTSCDASSRVINWPVVISFLRLAQEARGGWHAARLVNRLPTYMTIMLQLQSLKDNDNICSHQQYIRQHGHNLCTARQSPRDQIILTRFYLHCLPMCECGLQVNEAQLHWSGPGLGPPPALPAPTGYTRQPLLPTRASAPTSQAPLPPGRTTFR